MTKVKKTVSLLLATLILLSISTAAPFTAGAAQAPASSKSADFDVITHLPAPGTVEVTSQEDYVYISFTPSTGGLYNIYSTGSIDTLGILLDADGNEIDSNDDGGNGLNFLITRQLTAGETYYIGAKCYSAGDAGALFNIVVEEIPTPTTEPTPISEPASGGTDPTEIAPVVSEPSAANIISYLTAPGTVEVTSREDYVYISFTPYITGEYRVYSTGSIDTLGILLDADGNVIEADDDDGDSLNFLITRNLTAGETYYIGARCYSSGNAGASFNVVVEGLGGSIGTEPAPTTTEDLGLDVVTHLTSPGTVEVTSQEDYVYISFTPSTDSQYSIYSTGSVDTKGTLLDSAGNEIESDDDSGGDYNFRITLYLTAGETYYIGAKCFYSDDIGASFNVVVEDLGGPVVTEPAPTTEPAPATDPYEPTVPSGEDATDPTVEPAPVVPIVSYLTAPGTVEITSQEDYVYISFTPSITGEYRIYSTGEYDTVGTLLDADGNEIEADDDGGDSLNFLITKQLTAGTTYYIGAKCYESCEEGAVFNVVVEGLGGQIFTEPAPTTEPATSSTDPYEPTVPSGEDASDYCYRLLSDGTAEIIDYRGNSSDIVIPQQINGYTVTVIGNSAFYENSFIESAIIPGTVTAVEDWAFGSCENLRQVSINDSVRTIGSSAFRGCESLTSVKLPRFLKRIEGYTFDGCTSLPEIEIPQNVSFIGNYAFKNCGSLEEIIIPASVKTVDVGAFRDCANACDVTVLNKNATLMLYSVGFVYDDYEEELLPLDGITIYGFTGSSAETYAEENGFSFASIDSQWQEPPRSSDFEYELLNDGTAQITGYTGDSSYVFIPAEIDGFAVTSIGVYAFYNNLQINAVAIPQGVKTVEEGAFCFCENLSSVAMSYGVSTIGSWAFSDCSSLTSVTVPDSVTHIGRSAFERSAWYDAQPQGVVYAGNVAYGYKGDMSAGTSLTLRDGTVAIADYAFQGCSNLSRVVIPNGVTVLGINAFDSCAGLEEISLPPTVGEIGRYCFCYCSKLGSIEIPNGVSKIDYFTFVGCSSLANITVPQSVVCIMDMAFEGTQWLSNQPVGVVYAGNVAYAYNTAIPDRVTSITLNSDAVGISPNAFTSLENLTRITIPDTVVYIGDYAFGFFYDEEYSRIADFTVYGGLNTAAQKYAKAFDLDFVSITSTDPTAPTVITDPTAPAESTDSTASTASTRPTSPVRPGGSSSGGSSSGGSTSGSGKTTISLSRYSAAIYVKGSVKIKASIKNKKGTTVFMSSNPGVAQVSSSGKVIGIKKGKATITVVNNGVKKTFKVTVKNPKLNKTKKALKKGKTFKLRITGKIGKAKFKSSNKKVAAVTKSGKIKAKKRGKATITVTANGVKLRCKITVK